MYCCLLLASATVVYGFTPEEVEIFQVQGELLKKYGPDMDFYKFLKLPQLRDSTSKEIVKNLRRLSKKYHPDRNKKYKKLYEKLNIISNILSDHSRRKTYDYYLRNGFPDYNYSKGGFFFKRVQPKTGVLALFIFIAASIIHYVLLRLQNSSNKKRIENFIKQCKDNDDTNGLGERMLTFKQYEDADPKEILVSLGDVYVLESDGKKTLISTKDVPDPTIFDTIFFKLPLFFWRSTVTRLFSKSEPVKEGRVEAEASDESGSVSTADNGQKKIKKRKKNTPTTSREKLVLPSGETAYSRKKR